MDVSSTLLDSSSACPLTPLEFVICLTSIAGNVSARLLIRLELMEKEEYVSEGYTSLSCPFVAS